MSLKDKAKIFANLDKNLLALPRTAFCSWMIIGILRSFAAIKGVTDE